MEALAVQTNSPNYAHNPNLTLKSGNQFDAQMMVALHELLQGERASVNIFSKALDGEICFFNPALVDPLELDDTLPAYSTRELAFVLSLSAEELQRYHHLKTCLV